MPRGVVLFARLASRCSPVVHRSAFCPFFPFLAGSGTIGRRGFWQGNNRVSKRLDAHKSSDPFARAGKQKTSFAVCYNSGGIPCRLDHGAVKCKLRWDRAPAELGPWKNIRRTPQNIACASAYHTAMARAISHCRV